tara:strand:+ start:370 stop:783 length:414 start_codon:yes stop_codon:yes gene_type:complete
MADLINRPDTECEDGFLTHQGVENDEGEIIIPRHKPKKHPDLTTEENYILERWTKQGIRDYPDIDPFWVETIMYHCIAKSEEAEKYAGENEHKIFQTRSEAEDCWKKIEKVNTNVTRAKSEYHYTHLGEELEEIEEM